MKPFMDKDFLLDTEAAKVLYHEYAEKMPIIDYHCHIDPMEIAEDVRWGAEPLPEVTLGIITSGVLCALPEYRKST